MVGHCDKAMMRGLPWPLQRGHCTPRSATRMLASGSRGFTRKSRSALGPWETAGGLVSVARANGVTALKQTT